MFSSITIDNVYQTLLEAGVLVLLVILLFLRSLRSVAVPLVTIPVSLIGTFFMMWLLGFSINTLTLLAMVLAVGLVRSIRMPSGSRAWISVFTAGTSCPARSTSR